MRFLLAAIVGVAVFIIAAITMYLGPDDLRSCTTPQADGPCSTVDAIVAVSGGDTNARADQAIALYKAGWAPKLIFSGAAADPSGPSNAAAMARRATTAGVPEGSVIVEEFSRTTAENARNTSAFIADHSIQRIILVTSAYHQRRASLEFGSALGQNVLIRNHPVSSDKQWSGFWWWTTKQGWWLAIGELVKIIAYYGEESAGNL